MAGLQVLSMTGCGTITFTEVLRSLACWHNNLEFCGECSDSHMIAGLWLCWCVCRKLHNLCIDRYSAVPAQRFAPDILPSDQWFVHNNTKNDDGIHQVRATGERRREITVELDQLGI